MSHCCHHETETKSTRHIDWLLLISSSVILIAWLFAALLSTFAVPYWTRFSLAVFELLNTMAWGIGLGIIFIGLIGRVPREFIVSILGRENSFNSILRACFAGVLLDLCSHGILMVGAKLYERGVSTAQVMAFLIASPWNSLSLTLILWAMVGFGWMITFLLLSMLIACITGVIFQSMEKRGFIYANPNKPDIPQNFNLLENARQGLANTRFDLKFFKQVLGQGILDSRMVMRWIFFGIIIAALIRTLLDTDDFAIWFGPTLAGLGMTLLAATILEVCSEGTLPVAADLLTRADAPGNSLTFLMAGVSTDYTEILVLNETTKNWKIPLLLPAITLPQIILLGLVLNSI